jgi:hypothetical protein
MQANRYHSLHEAVQGLKARGFTAEFRLENGKLKDLDSGRTYAEDEVLIVEFHRFEGQTNPSDMSIVFALEADPACKGMVVSSYGPYADQDLVEFLNEVPMEDRA